MSDNQNGSPQMPPLGLGQHRGLHWLQCMAAVPPRVRRAVL